MLSKVNVQTALRLAQRCYHLQQNTGERYVLNLLGSPGQGKTALSHEHVLNLSKIRENDKSITLKSYRLNQSDPTDVKGVPMYVENENGLKTCEWAIPQIFPIKGSSTSGKADFTLFLFDEFNQAAPSMQNLVANVIDQVVGDQVLDYKRHQIILAGNRAEDGAAVYSMPTNLKTRLISVILENDFNDWLNWASKNKIHPAIIGYLKQFESKFNSPISGDEYSSYCNPRTWHRLSDDILLHENWAEDDDSYIMACSILGHEAGASFFSFVKNYSAKFSISDILNQGSKANIPFDSLEYFYTIVVELSYKLSGILQNYNSLKLKTDSFTLKEEDYFYINNIYDWLLSADVSKPIKLIFGTLFERSDYDFLMRLIKSDVKLQKADECYTNLTKQLHAK